MTLRGAHIQVDHVSHAYKRGGALAIRDITFEVEPGEAMVLVGRSGCGKSTLLQILCGLIAPGEGSILIDGKTVTGPSPDWVMMFQAPSLYPWMTVEQNVALGLRFSGRSREIKTRVPEMLELVELGAFAKRNVQDLSGGQQQRVALARSLAPHPHVLLLDEPLSALDAFTRHALQRDIRRIAREMGITLVLVTHDLAEAVVMADRAAVLSANPGRVRDIVSIDLANRDDLRSPEYARARARLAAAYEKAAGLELGAETQSASAPTSGDEDQPAATAPASAGC